MAYRARDGWRMARSSRARANDRDGRRRQKLDYALFSILSSSTQNDSWKSTNIEVVEGCASFTEIPSEIKMVEKRKNKLEPKSGEIKGLKILTDLVKLQYWRASLDKFLQIKRSRTGLGFQQQSRRGDIRLY